MKLFASAPQPKKILMAIILVAVGTVASVAVVRTVGTEIPVERVLKGQPALDRIVLDYMNSDRIVGMAVGTVVRGRIDYLRGFGFQDREAGVPVAAAKTMFRWASISKSLAGVSAVKLASQGKVDLDSPIADLLPGYSQPVSYTQVCEGERTKSLDGTRVPCKEGFFEIPLNENARPISSRLLLGHLAGIPHYRNGKGSPHPPQESADDPGRNTGMKWALPYLTRLPLVSPPGSAYNYSTFGFNLLGVVLESAARETFADIVAREISGPLGLATLQPDYEWTSIPDRAVGYQRRMGLVVRQGSHDVSWKLAGGGFISTAEDLAGYCRGLMDKEFLSDDEKAQLWTSQQTTDGEKTGYGLGFSVGTFEGRQQVAHGGSQEKTRTHLRLLPDDQICVVAMSNSANANPAKVTEEIAKALFTQD